MSPEGSTQDAQWGGKRTDVLLVEAVFLTSLHCAVGLCCTQSSLHLHEETGIEKRDLEELKTLKETTKECDRHGVRNGGRVGCIPTIEWS